MCAPKLEIGVFQRTVPKLLVQRVVSCNDGSSPPSVSSIVSQKRLDEICFGFFRFMTELREAHRAWKWFPLTFEIPTAKQMINSASQSNNRNPLANLLILDLICRHFWTALKRFSRYGQEQDKGFMCL